MEPQDLTWWFSWLPNLYYIGPLFQGPQQFLVIHSRFFFRRIAKFVFSLVNTASCCSSLLTQSLNTWFSFSRVFDKSNQVKAINSGYATVDTTSCHSFMINRSLVKPWKHSTTWIRESKDIAPNPQRALFFTHCGNFILWGSQKSQDMPKQSLI